MMQNVLNRSNQRKETYITTKKTDKRSSLHFLITLQLLVLYTIVMIDHDSFSYL